MRLFPKSKDETIQYELDCLLKKLVQEDETNRSNGDPGTLFFDEPLIGYADGDDPIFEQFKKVVSPSHLTPREFYKKIHPLNKNQPLTVVSWILPLSEAVRKANRSQSKYPAPQWIDAKLRGGVFQRNVRERIIQYFEENAIEAIRTTDPAAYWVSYESNPIFHIDLTWSERHAAYAAGLGTFGLCGGLITPKGKAMRCGSVICAARLPVTSRPYQTHTEYCTFYQDGSCGICMENCPAGAISEQGKNTQRCKEYIERVRDMVVHKEYHLNEQGCGLCQVNVPCEAKSP
jgi:epoxyqueuosine reductase